MGKYSDTAVYSLITQALAADLFLFHKSSDNAEHLITFANLVASIEALFNRKLITNIITGSTVLDDAYEFVVANSGSAMNITLPLAATYPGQQYIISNKGAGVATILRSGGDTIDAGTSVALAQWADALLISDGVNCWHHIA